MSNARIELGAKGEAAAAAYLERIGLSIIDRNWRCPAGEVDLVALDGDTLVLVEVKTRKSVRTGTPEEAVSPSKQKRLVRLARTYIALAGLEDVVLRFDVIAIRVLGEDRALLRHHKAAFIPGD